MAESKKYLHLIRRNIKTLILFELIYKGLVLVLFTPLVTGLVSLLMHIRGYHYLSFENLKAFALHPVTIAMAILIIVLIVLYSIFDICAIIYILDASYQNKDITLRDTFRLTLPNLKRVMHQNNGGLILLVFFMIPFFNLGVASSYLSTISIPGFIMDFITHNRLALIGLCLGFIVVGVFLIRWTYALHYFVLENCSFKEARRRSVALNPWKKGLDFLILVGLQLLYYIVFLLLGMVLIWIILSLSKLFATYSVVHSAISSVVWFALILQIILFLALTTPVSYAVVSKLFYYHKEKSNEDYVPVSLSSSKPAIEKIKKSSKKARHRKHLLVFASFAIIFALYASEMTSGDANPDVEYIKTMEVTAHRGASANYPENTLSAFKGANRQGADWVELDVQQTSDGQIIVMHDTNLKRICNVDKAIWNTTYDELTYLDAGIWFSDEFAGEPIPLLSDVIDWAILNGMQLNIELKPTGHETNFEQTVIDIINAHHFKNHCVVTSQKYNVLYNVKKIDPDISTVYVMSFAYGNITSLKYADGFSIEASNITSKMVDDVHNQGKQIYAWTVNSQPTMRRMIQLNVDNIITDDVTLARQTVYDSKTTNMIRDYMDFLSNWLPSFSI